MDLYWLDLETTGLDPKKDDILEMCIYKSTLEDAFNVVEVCNRVFRYPDYKHADMSQFVLEMHTANGLLGACSNSDNHRFDAEHDLLKLIPEIEDHSSKPTLAGNSVHFDHEFLKKQMPRLAARFSHRHYDVSSIVLFCRSLGMLKPKKAEAHRAKEDVLESVELAKKCAEWIADLPCTMVGLQP